jgi:putative ABC transport system substrate-binding protein
LAAELVRLDVDVIVTQGTPGTPAAKGATTTIPIVMAISGDAIATGLIASLSHPGGNVTGSTFFNPELCAKRLELLKEAFPRIRRVAELLNPDNPVNGPILQATESEALKLELEQFEVRRPNEFENAFSSMVMRRVDAVALIDDPMHIANIGTIADLALEKRLPSIGFLNLPNAGGLIGYSANFDDIHRRAAYFVDKILKGAKPSDLSVERATRFKLLINLKTAEALGLTLPQSLLSRADEMIQ